MGWVLNYFKPLKIYLSVNQTLLAKQYWYFQHFRFNTSILNLFWGKLFHKDAVNRFKDRPGREMGKNWKCFFIDTKFLNIRSFFSVCVLWLSGIIKGAPTTKPSYQTKLPPCVTHTHVGRKRRVKTVGGFCDVAFGGFLTRGLWRW